MPVIFVGHGSPELAFDTQKGDELAAWAQSLPAPKAILGISAHWSANRTTIGSDRTQPLIYDFQGFPKNFYELRYAPPGAPALGRRLEQLLSATQLLSKSPMRGLDHGVWVPLLHMFPKADVPVMQLAMPYAPPPTEGFSAEALFDLGRALAPLRSEGILLMATGNITHNLRQLGPDGILAPSWAEEFDAWIAETLENWDIDALLDYRFRAPSLKTAHPTEDHLAPLFVAVGAAAQVAAKPVVSFPITGFEHASLSRRCVELH